MMTTTKNCNCEMVVHIKKHALKKGLLLYGNTSCEKALQETNRLIHEEIASHLRVIGNKEMLKMLHCVFCHDSMYNENSFKIDPSGYESRVKSFSLASAPPESDGIEPLGRRFGSILNFSESME